MINPIPSGWLECSLNDVSTLVTKGTTPTKYAANNTKSGIKFIRVENISNRGTIDERDLKFIDINTHKTLKRSQLHAGDLLVSIAGAIGRMAIVSEKNLPANTNQAVGIVRLCNDEIIPDFAKFVIESPYVAKQIHDSQAGNAQINLNLSQLGGLKLYLPPFREQHKIATILSSVDEVIEKTRTQIGKLKDLKTGMMQELLTKGIGHTEFKDSPVGRIPASWEVKKLGEITSLIKSGLSRRIVSQDIGIPLLISGNIKHGQLDTTELKYWYVDDPQGANTRNYVLNDGDILMCFINSMSQIGKNCIYRDIGRPVIYTTNLFRIVPRSEYSSEYLQMNFSTRRFQEEIQLISKPAVNQASFTKSDLEQLCIPVPPQQERSLVTQIVTSVGDKIIATERKLLSLTNIKKALMQDLLTGKVRVNVENHQEERMAV